MCEKWVEFVIAGLSVVTWDQGTVPGDVPSAEVLLLEDAVHHAELTGDFDCSEGGALSGRSVVRWYPQPDGGFRCSLAMRGLDVSVSAGDCKDCNVPKIDPSVASLRSVRPETLPTVAEGAVGRVRFGGGELYVRDTETFEACTGWDCNERDEWGMFANEVRWRVCADHQPAMQIQFADEVGLERAQIDVDLTGDSYFLGSFRRTPPPRAFIGNRPFLTDFMHFGPFMGSEKKPLQLKQQGVSPPSTECPPLVVRLEQLNADEFNFVRGRVH